MSANIRVLLLMNRIASYRVACYNLIAKKVDLTIGYTDKDDDPRQGDYNRICLPTWRIGHWRIQKPGFRSLCKQYDVVIFVGDLHSVNYCLLPWMGGPFKTAVWCMGIRASYTKIYDIKRRHTIIDWVYGLMLRKSDACIFYMKEPLKFWGDAIDYNKVFVAINTVPVSYVDHCTPRKNVLFVGTLYRGKGIERLLNVYNQVLLDGLLPPHLDIVGDGEEREALEGKVKNSALCDYISFHGAIYDEDVLGRLFATAIVCVSPGQAGLTVLKSMGYGVPFVTSEGAITGGEILNIVHGYNGMILSNDEDWRRLVVQITTTPEVFGEMGRRAREYYLKSATTEKMASGVLSAIEYTLVAHP
ncbi:glycosyltransferase family 4 protein [Opitutus sp. ER46]|uniref:glycosyltransferase family 4 protein n=1 Tax=Opitutus sp. ER46 TaxID=2161864 RepID=UPI000D30C481|nr:glycosyltransferase family 4 protein [Opitutus sp. ER46]PTX98382.1 glycosyltransferase [Opitutus sp. ER46]